MLPRSFDKPVIRAESKACHNQKASFIPSGVYPIFYEGESRYMRRDAFTKADPLLFCPLIQGSKLQSKSISSTAPYHSDDSNNNGHRHSQSDSSSRSLDQNPEGGEQKEKMERPQHSLMEHPLLEHSLVDGFEACLFSFQGDCRDYLPRVCSA